jgi:hypothetical protein
VLWSCPGICVESPIWKHHYRYITDSGVMTWTRTISSTKVAGWRVQGEKKQGATANLLDGLRKLLRSIRRSM